ncbi:SDR family NAD(P)-dependent oxidoreductase [Sphingobium phenoxybenzoativorans]|uniref:SDR family NAD(P)-dependent oxidoreductase n=1 Tax=Sphingobium phenoxybenzoativorans TaxID=1592790 RepID=UPI0008730FC3|nr:glucose 1-dehydrogenase [Sphingobium phenoxybenzoativorans]
MNRVQGKTAIVTGGASGIGEGIVRALVAQGANVVFGDIDAEKGRALAESLGAKAVFQQHDATSEPSWRDMLAAAEKAFGTVNVLVNNVGGLEAAPLETWDGAKFQRALDLNLFSAFFGVTAVTPIMKKAGGGSIINIASMAAMRGYPAIIGYVSAKWAVRGMTKAAAVELGAYGIRVNAVHPGQTQTPATEKAPFKTDHVALKRLGQPDDIAQIVLFLASDDARWVTGADYMADGGELAGDATYAGYPED